ncbi:hypothetical protein OG894_28790 [Streptomyces sp. NBC_01724]|nr:MULTISPECIES: hypothetical protein [unclassified Streptomyces]WNO64652.1 hypothetical protein RPQ02_12970 [Streptomyces sp. AM2-3-1]WTE59727.1 hypothetical protein OG784_13525 [Streptomyces sp. NBC_01617]
MESHAESSWYILHSEMTRACEERGAPLSKVRPFVDVSGRGKVLGKPLA